jgi:hypothetical protein
MQQNNNAAITNIVIIITVVSNILLLFIVSKRITVIINIAIKQNRINVKKYSIINPSMLYLYVSINSVFQK